jgi:squalene synthase HpnC
VLPRASRAHLLAIYGFARLADELGDSVSGDRPAALDWLEGELDAAFVGKARSPIMRTLSATLGACELPRGPFVALIEANRVDQRVKRYESWEQLLSYCELSANPVGELVLRVLGVASEELMALSDAICTGLQLAEHWQDVAEDRDNGRIYLPAEDLERFGCGPADLEGSHTPPRLRELVAFEAARTHALFDRGAPLLTELHGRPKLAVAAFIGGGRAALDAIERADWDVLAGAPRAGTVRRLIASGRALRGSRG